MDILFLQAEDLWAKKKEFYPDRLPYGGLPCSAEGWSKTFRGTEPAVGHSLDNSALKERANIK